LDSTYKHKCAWYPGMGCKQAACHHTSRGQYGIGRRLVILETALRVHPGLWLFDGAFPD
jgi:hypothetical protein